MRNANKVEAGRPDTTTSDTPNPIACGIVMPISQTSSHSESHWRSVQTLLHRAVTDAGFTPLNVWESASTDRISERIIGNIFECSLLIADISDLNPNVMLELGLRLSSKKPTIVIAHEGSSIPFDIRDFQAIFYPSDMNMLGMEDFFRKLAKILRERHSAYTDGTYTPFLANVIVDVASPETREVGFNELILSRLDDIAGRLVTLESANRRTPTRSGAVEARARSRPTTRGHIDLVLPEDKIEEFSSEIRNYYEVDGIEIEMSIDGRSKASVRYSGATDENAFVSRIMNLVHHLGGEVEVVF